LKRPEIAYPHYKHLDIERQVRQPDGSWSDWEPADQERNQQILDNLPEEEEEWTPETVRISSLVAPLPFLKAGFWERVHVARLVPKEKLQAPVVAAGGPEGGFSSGMPGESMAMSRPEMMAPPPMEMSSSGMMSGSEGGMYNMMGGGGAESINFEKTDADEIMVRALDFTVEQNTTYRFRIRVVVYNPNRGREDVSPGVDTASAELFGPWSEPTGEVTMPPDVATYAIAKEPPVQKKLEQVSYEVARWEPETGVTVVKRFTAGPGDLIGGEPPRTTEIPSSEGKGKQSKKVDFNSHQLVLDAMGGNQPIPQIGAGAGLLPIPVLSLVVNPDGSVVIRSQAHDLHDPVRRDMAENYTRELKESDKKRQSAQGFEFAGSSGSSAMMP